MKKSILILVTLFISISLFAQQTKEEIPEMYITDYDFINYKYCDIRIPGNDSSRLNVFFKKLDTLVCSEQGRINVLHIGGSHVQADILSNEVRRNLDFVNADNQPPRGFIFPFSVAKTNNPENYKVSYSGVWSSARNVQKNREIPLGMAGIAVYTSDSTAQINIDLNPDSILRWEFDQLRLLGYVEDGSEGVKPVLYYNNDTIEGLWDYTGSAYLFPLPSPAYSFSVGFIQQDTVPHVFVVNGFIPERETSGIVYHAIGVNGASVPSYLNSEYFEEELRLIPPDLVVFAIGINDATSKDFTIETFCQNYDALIEKIERVSPGCAYIFITNNDSFLRISRRKYRVNPNGVVARAAFYRLAEKYQGGVWDLFSLMGGLRSMQKWQNAGLAKRDKIHFTRDGYILIGDLFYNALIQYYKQTNF